MLLSRCAHHEATHQILYDTPEVASRNFQPCALLSSKSRAGQPLAGPLAGPAIWLCTKYSISKSIQLHQAVNALRGAYGNEVLPSVMSRAGAEVYPEDSQAHWQAFGDSQKALARSAVCCSCQSIHRLAAAASQRFKVCPNLIEDWKAQHTTNLTVYVSLGCAFLPII